MIGDSNDETNFSNRFFHYNLVIERRLIKIALTLEKLKINRILEVFSFRRCNLVI